MSKNDIKYFINAIKAREGFRFDKEIANFMGIDKYALANSKLRSQLPKGYVNWYCEKYDVPLKDFHKDIKSESTGETLRNPEYAEKRSLEIEVEDLRLENEHLSKRVIELQEQLIELLKDK